MYINQKKIIQNKKNNFQKNIYYKYYFFFQINLIEKKILLLNLII